MAKQLLNTLKNTAVYALGNFAIRLIALVLIPVFTNTEYISVADFGAFSLLEVLVQLLMSVMGLGLYMGFSRFYWDESYKKHQKAMFFNSFVITLVLAVALGCIAWFGASFVNRILFPIGNYQYPIQLAVVSAGLQSLFLVVLTLLKLQSRSTYYSSLNIVRALSTLGFTYVLVLINRSGLDGLYEAQIISLSICVLASLPLIVKNSSIAFPTQMLKELTKYSFPLMVSAVMILLVGALDKFVLNSISGLEKVAVYALGFKLSNSIKVFVITSVQLALSPILMKKVNEPDHGSFYNTVLQLFSVGLMFVILVSAAFAGEIIQLFTVEEVYAKAYLVFVILAFGFYFEMVKDNVVIGLVVSKKAVLSGAISVFIAILSLVLYRWFVPLWGIDGVAIVFAFVQIIYFVVIYIAAQKVHPIPYNIKRVLLILFIGMGLFLPVYFTADLSFVLKYGVKCIVIILYPILIIRFGILPLHEIKAFRRSLSKGKM